jgi:hypothetical protein
MAPALAFIYRQGPISAVASSTEYTKGNLLPICLAFLVFTAINSVLALIVDYLPQPILFVTNLVLSFAGLYLYAMVVVVFRWLHPEPTLNMDLAHKAAQSR